MQAARRKEAQSGDSTEELRQGARRDDRHTGQQRQGEGSIWQAVHAGDTSRW